MTDLTAVKAALRGQRIETPSWAYANSGTRFKVFAVPGVPRDPEEKIADAAMVHRLTGVAPSVALHIPWDRVDDYAALAARHLVERHHANFAGGLYDLAVRSTQCEPRHTRQTVTAIIHATSHDKLSVIPSGNPRRRSPELLTSPSLGRLITNLKSRYDVVIFDTPPLAAGIDGYAIAAATGSLLVVIRIGQTAKRMAAAKLLLVDRLPINVVGAVLNAVPSTGEYESRSRSEMRL